MWLMVLYDLPVKTRAQRRAAAQFRADLLDLGFLMAQYSVYMRCCSGRDMLETMFRRIEACMPEYGRVRCLAITDKQYESIRIYEARKRKPALKNEGQLILL